LTKHTEELLDIATEVLFQPSFPEEEYEKLKKQTLSGLAASKDDPNSIASNVSSVVVYGPEHPYGNITTESTVENISLEDCKGYYDTYFKPNSSYLVIVGDVSLDNAREYAETYFGSWASGEVPEKSFAFPERPSQPQVDMSSREAVQSVIQITYPVDLQPGSPDAIPARVMNALLGGGSNGYLFQNLREDKAYTYGAYSRLSSDRYVGQFSASASVRNEVTDSALTEFLYEMERIRSTQVGEEELQMVKNELTGSFARSLESPQTIARYALNTVRYQLPDDYYATYLEKLNQVTPEDVQAMARKYILPDQAHIVVVGAESIAEKIARFDGDGNITYYSPFGEVVEKMDAPVDVTSEGILEGYIEAIGGREKLEAVKDMTMTMSTEFNGMKMKTEVKKKAPGKLQSVVFVNGNPMATQVFNGESGSITQGGQTTQAQGPMLDQLKATAPLFIEMEYVERGYDLEVGGIEEVDGKKAYRLLVTDPAGNQFTEFYEVDSRLKIRSVAEINGQMATTDYRDYTEVDGIKFPFVVKTSVPLPLTMSVESVEINTGIEDSVFEPK
jgi:predicted Zn-dependent peptidase